MLTAGACISPLFSASAVHHEFAVQRTYLVPSLACTCLCFTFLACHRGTFVTCKMLSTYKACMQSVHLGGRCFLSSCLEALHRLLWCRRYAKGTAEHIASSSRWAAEELSSAVQRQYDQTAAWGSKVTVNTQTWVKEHVWVRAYLCPIMHS